MIVFENRGEIDVTSITTFGVSVKESENPIGFFGTGLKYAIAIALREGCAVEIHSGDQRHVFGTERKDVRGKSFSFVTISTNQSPPERMGFTTEVGKKWELWQAYRELYCNARDEGGSVYRTKEFQALPGHTQVVVRGAPFEAVHGKHLEYFSEADPDLTVGSIQIGFHSSPSFFYRGVKVFDLPRNSLFTYNETGRMELTEDRSAKGGWWDCQYKIICAVKESTDDHFIRKVVTAEAPLLEQSLDFHGWGSPPSDAFLRTVGQLAHVGDERLNKTAKTVWEEARPVVFAPRETPMTSIQRATLGRALSFCGKIGFAIEGAYPIKVVETLGKDVLGLARDETIYLAERNFHQGGAKQVAATLIEEFVHLRHGHKDLTRGLQNYLLERLVSIGEEFVGGPL